MSAASSVDGMIPHMQTCRHSCSRDMMPGCWRESAVGTGVVERKEEGARRQEVRDAAFPLGEVRKGTAHVDQPSTSHAARRAGGAEHSGSGSCWRTDPHCSLVRAHQLSTDRARSTAITLWYPAKVAASAQVSCNLLCCVVAGRACSARGAVWGWPRRH